LLLNNNAECIIRKAQYKENNVALYSFNYDMVYIVVFCWS